MAKKNKITDSKLSSILLGIIIIALYLAIYSALGKVAGFLPLSRKHLYLIEVVVYTIMTIFLVIILKILKKTNILKFNFKSFMKGLGVGGFALFLSISMFITTYHECIDKGYKFLPIGQIIAFSIAIIIGTGLTEEILCRGIVQNIMFDAFGRNSKKQVLVSIIISSILFGTAHFVNYFNTDASFEGVLTQVIVASLIGLYFGAIYARSHSIWAVALLHGLFDFGQMIDDGFFGMSSVSETISSYHLSQIMAPAIIYIALTLFLLRKSKIKECYENKKAS